MKTISGVDGPKCSRIAKETRLVDGGGSLKMWVGSGGGDFASLEGRGEGGGDVKWLKSAPFGPEPLQGLFPGWKTF